MSSARPVVAPLLVTLVIVAAWPTLPRSTSVKVTAMVDVSAAVSVCSFRLVGVIAGIAGIAGLSLEPVIVTTKVCVATGPSLSSISIV